jgi:FkbM family methyltransferase
MNITKIADHSVDMDAVPEKPVVLDAGSRSYGFALGMLEKRPGGAVIALEPDPTMTYMTPIGVKLVREALVGNNRQFSFLAITPSEEARFLLEGMVDKYRYGYGYHDNVPTAHVRCTNIVSLMQRVGVTHWDVVKMDIESSEFEVLENWPGPIATQISVEFHDWPHLDRYSTDYYNRLLTGPLKDYEFVKHDMYGIGGGPEIGHWDSLLKLKR